MVKTTSPELSLQEVFELSKRPKFWGWNQGMYIGGNDDMIAMRFLHGYQYEPTTRDLWKKVCRGAEVVADIGTHSGIFTLDAFGEGVKHVLSVEPHPINYARLVLNLRHSGYEFQGCFFGALGHEEGVSFLRVGELYKCHAAGHIGPPTEKSISFPTSMRRMDTVLPEEYWPKLKAVKIDAENMTGNVLLGMGKILDYRPDLILECTQGGMERVLSPLGYKFWEIRETGEITQVEKLLPFNPDDNYNGTDENVRNRFASVRDLP